MVTKKKYGSTPTDKIKERIGNLGKYSKSKIVKDNIPMYTIKDENRIRIMPPKDDGEFYGFDVHIHYGVGIDELSFVCLQNTFGETCPICQHQKKLGNEKVSKEVFVSFYPARRVFMNIVDLEETDKGVQIFNAPANKVADEILRASVDKDSGEVLAIEDPVDGYNITFERSGKGKHTTYQAVNIARKSSAIEDPDWLDGIQDLADVLVIPSQEEMLAALGSQDAGDLEKDQEEKEEKEKVEEEKEVVVEEEKEVVEEKEEKEPEEDPIKKKIREKLEAKKKK